MRVIVTDGGRNVALSVSTDEAFDLGLNLIARARDHNGRNEGRSVYNTSDEKKFHILFNQNNGCPWHKD